MLAQAFMESCVVFDNSAYGITCTAEAEPVKSEKQWYGSGASSIAVAALPLRRLVPMWLLLLVMRCIRDDVAHRTRLYHAQNNRRHCSAAHHSISCRPRCALHTRAAVLCCSSCAIVSHRDPTAASGVLLALEASIRRGFAALRLCGFAGRLCGTTLRLRFTAWFVSGTGRRRAARSWRAHV
jgi:hypothetical protein